MAGTSGFEPEHAGVKVLCLTGLATSQYIIYGGQSRIRTCKSFPANGFQDRFLAARTCGIFWCVPRDSNPYSQKRTAPSRQRVYQIPPGTHIVFWNWKQMDSNHRVTYCNRSSIASVLPYDLLPVPLRDSNLALQAWKARVLNHLDQEAILVGVTGVEPAWIFIQRLLRPLCIPVSAHAENYNNFYIIYNTPIGCWCQAFLKNYLKNELLRLSI